MNINHPLFALGLVAVIQPVSGEASGRDWHQEPFRVMAGERPLDTFANDPGGHAAPFLADITGDGRRDLVVGSIGGRFHFFRNVGSDAAPKFGEKSTFLMAGLSVDEPARVPNYCCIASGPQLLDIDGDGVIDLTSGSYAPGFVYWFKGRGDGGFHVRQMLTDIACRPVVPVPKANPYSDNLGNYAVNVAWTDWDANGTPDMILGNTEGRLLVRLNAKGLMEGILPAPIDSQPMFMLQAVNARPMEITVQGGNAIPDHHAAPAVADWDGDGLWDILVGSASGRVFWLKNTGRAGAPEFVNREELLGPGSPGYWLEPGQAAGQTPDRGIRSQIHAVDYNLDGKMDLLVGEWAIVREPRADLTAAERKEMGRLRRELSALDAKMEFDPAAELRYKWDAYTDNKQLLQRAQQLETELTRFQVRFHDDPHQPQSRFMNFQRYSGNVWVYLRK